MGISSLDTALSGLRISQQQIDVISNNVANVGTDGYTRKILPQSTQVVDGQSIGVLPGIITRSVDLRLERDLWTQISAVSNFDVRASYLGRIDQFHGDPAANVSVAGEVGKLQDTFAALSNAPDDQFLLSSAVNQALDTANKINSLAGYYTTLRNDVQNDADVAIDAINDLLDQIADLNAQIRFSKVSNRTSAITEDSRDRAVEKLSELIDISVFSRGDGVLVVQTAEGVELASNIAAELSFRPTPLSATSSYPDSAAGIFVGDPTKINGAIEITTSKLGGKLGGLIDLRDEVFPQKTAQIDELAHKMALRFEAQGLRLFTDASGTVPADTPPDTSSVPATSVQYVGFAAIMQVNNSILSDHSLIQAGTYGGSLPSGSNDVIRRVIEYTFGDVDHQLAANSDAATSVDIRAAATGATTLQDWLGLSAINRVTSGLSLSNYASIADLVTAGGTDAFGSGATETDRFIVRFDDPDFGGGPYDMDIDLRGVATTGISAAQDLVAHITADPDWAAAVADFGASVSVGVNGELIIESSSNIEISNSAIEPLSDLGFDFLGLTPLVSQAEDPYFDVSVGNNEAVRITIGPSDTEVDLLAKLNAVNGLIAQIDTDGFLSMRGGNSFSNPDFGGDILIIGGANTISGASLGGTAAGRASLDDGVNIAQALFGTYNITGTIIEEFSPVTDIEYQSEVEQGSGVFVAFRSEFLGPDASINTGIASSLTIKDYSQKIISQASQELALVNSRVGDERSLQGLLKQQILDDSGVNLDEELGHLIVVQTSYAASARVINIINEIFQELLNVI